MDIYYPPAYLVKQAGDCKEGAPRLMANLYLFKITEYEFVSQGASGLQPIHLKEVSTVPGCIHRVLRSTSR